MREKPHCEPLTIELKPQGASEPQKKLANSDFSTSELFDLDLCVIWGSPSKVGLVGCYMMTNRKG